MYVGSWPLLSDIPVICYTFLTDISGVRPEEHDLALNQTNEGHNVNGHIYLTPKSCPSGLFLTQEPRENLTILHYGIPGNDAVSLKH